MTHSRWILPLVVGAAAGAVVSLLRLVLPDDLGFGWHVLLAVGCGAVIGLVVGAALRARRRSG